MIIFKFDQEPAYNPLDTTAIKGFQAIYKLQRFESLVARASLNETDYSLAVDLLAHALIEEGQALNLLDTLPRID